MILTFLQQIFISTFSIPGTLLGTGNKRVGGEGIERKSLPCPLYFRLRVQFSSVQSLSPFWLFETPWTAAHQASQSVTNSRSLLKLMSTESVMPSNHLIFCRPLLLLPLVFPSIRVSSKQSVLHIRWPEYWSFSFGISPSNECSGLISFRMDWLELPSRDSQESSLKPQFKSINSLALSFL